MLPGRTMPAIMQELERQMNNKRDFLMPTSFLMMSPGSKLVNKNSKKELDLTNHAHTQIANYLKIPQQYYDRMRIDQPHLLAANVNTWLGNQPAGQRRLIRTLDGRCRAFLSNRFLPIDNFDLVKILLPVIIESGCKIISAEITETRLYIKAVTDRITGEVKLGEKVQAGIVIQNSEVGLSRVEVSTLAYFLGCLNGAIINELAQVRHHIGKRINESDLEANSVYSKETVAADVRAYLLKARDSVRAALNQAMFTKILSNMRKAAGEQIENVEEVMEDVTDRYNLTSDECSAIMKNLINGGDTSWFGLSNAVTLAAHKTVTDYDKSTELERIGGHLLMMRAAA
jgi:hypothetical protein